VHNLGDAYAEQTYNDAPDGHVIELAWVRQWPLGHRDFTGLQTIPRVQELRATAEGPRLFQRPHPAIDGRITVEASHRITEWAVHQHPIVLPETGRGRILWPVEAGQTSRLSLTGPAPEPLTLAYDGAAGTLTLERPPCEPITAALAPGLEQLDLDLWTDREVLEAFIDDGRWTLTAVLAPKGSA
jgi:sucrose-6-phosphate hydrolase SacC (GH32 family)